MQPLHILIIIFLYLQAKTKVAKAERALAKVQEFLSPAELPTDLETITDEERFLFRRIGLKMRAFLMLGMTDAFHYTVAIWNSGYKHILTYIYLLNISQADEKFLMELYKICICIGSTESWLKLLSGERASHKSNILQSL